MPTAKVNGVRLYYEVKGRGQPLVVINGLGSDISEFAAVTDVLAKNHRVLALDNRGAGRSDKPDKPYSIQQMASDTAGVMRAAGFKRASVLGISMGGRIALELALSHPEMVEKLVLVSTFAQPGNRKGLGHFLLFHLIPRIPIMKGKYPQPYYAFARQREAVLSYSCMDRLKELRMPTLVAHGESDKTVRLALAKEMHEGIKGSVLKTFQGGHLFFLMRSRKPFIASVERFLSAKR